MGDRLGIHGAVDTFTSLGSDQYLAEETKEKQTQQLRKSPRRATVRPGFLVTIPPCSFLCCGR